MLKLDAPNILKQRCYSRKWGRGKGRFSGTVWLSIESIFYLENLLYIAAIIHGMSHFGPITYIINVRMVAAPSDQAAYGKDACQFYTVPS
jgi:hypothetical protein